MFTFAVVTPIEIVTLLSGARSRLNDMNVTVAFRSALRCRYSLSTLVFIVTCACIAVAAVCSYQRKLVEQLRFAKSLNPAILQTEDLLPQFAQWVFNDSPFVVVRSIHLNGKLQKVTDDDIVPLRGFSCLNDLALADAALTDASAETLQSIESLESLSLSGARLTDSSLVKLARLQKLTVLYIDGTSATDESLRALAKLERLRDLSVLDTRISPAGVQIISEFAGLERLRVNALDDQALDSLAKLSNLKELYLGTANVDQERIAALQEKLPNCKVIGGRRRGRQLTAAK